MLNFITSSTADTDLAVREEGLPPSALPDIDPKDRSQLPAGGGRWVIPPFFSTIGLTGMGWRSHPPYSDAALKHNRANADAMLADCLILTVLEERLRAASQLSWHIEALDESDNAQMVAASKVTLAISKTHQLQEFFFQLNYAKWYGKFALELLWEWDKYQPDMMICRGWSPVGGDSIVARYADGQWGRLVSSMYQGETSSYALGRVHYYTPSELESVVLHQYHKRAPDFLDSIGSGSIAGQGIRHGAYWLWFVRANLLAQLQDYIERLSSGIWKGKYEESNATARSDLEQAVAAYRSKHLLSLPMRRDGSLSSDLEVMEVGTASPAVITSAIEYIDRLLKAYISGRPGLSGSVGGDEVALQEGAISAVTKSDAVCLAEDLTANWLPTLYRYNCPGVPAGRFIFDTDHPAADKLLSYAQVMVGLGWSVNLDHLAEICGLQPGGINNQIATKVQSLSPVAVQSPPQQVPIAGNSPQVQQPVAAQADTSTSSGVINQ